MNQTQAVASRTRQDDRLVPVIHAGFFLIGIVNTLLGPILPLLSVSWSLDDAQSGSLFFVQSIAAIVGSALTGLTIRRFGFSKTLMSGFGLMSVSTVGLGFSSWPVGMICIAGTGLSLGLTIPTINLLISDINPTRRAAALNILNLAWGVGAVVGPLLVPIVSRRFSLSVALMLVAIPIGIMATLVRTDTQLETGQSELHRTATSLWLRPYFLLTAAFVFINIGTESAIGGWIASYVQRRSPSSQLAWGAATSLFWGGVLAGRAVAPLILKQMREVKMILLGLVVAVVGLLVILVSTTPAIVFLGIGLTGLGLAPVFPTTIAMFTGKLGNDAPRLIGMLFILAGLGAALFPWFVGLVSTYYKDLQVGLIIPLVGAILMLVIHGAVMRANPRAL